MKIVWVKWRDAVAEEADGPLHEDRLATLEEIGWWGGETIDSITLAMEKDEGGEIKPGRWRLHIPKQAIVEMKMVEFEEVFGKGKKRGPRRSRPSPSTALVDSTSAVEECSSPEK